MREIRFKLMSQVNLETLETSARTFGELKEAIKNSPLADKINFNTTTTTRDGVIWVSSVKLIDKATQVEYGKIDDAVLPATNCIFFVLPFEHKGGMNNAVDTVFDSIFEDYTNFEEAIDKIFNLANELGYNDLRSLGSRINYTEDANIDLSGKRDNILDNIFNWVGAFVEDNLIEEPIGGDTEYDDEESPHSKIITSLVNSLKHIIDILEAMQEMYYANENVYNDTLTDLHNKALNLQRQINS